MIEGREFSVWGLARNKTALGDRSALRGLLRHICLTIGMSELGEMSRNTDGGPSAILLIDTSHISIHCWPNENPYKDTLHDRDDVGYFIFGLQSCKDFDPQIVYDMLDATLGIVYHQSRGGPLE